MARVYVSSTVADLERERRAVMDWLVRAGHQPVHSYLPNSDTVQDSCLDDVDTCDLYVLILGHRYGFQPERDNPEGLSITHLEFRRAGQSGIPRIVLLSTSILDVSVSDVADPQRLALVSAFREEVAREVRPAMFSDQEGLILGLSTGVPAGLEMRGRQQSVGRAGGRVAGTVLRLAPRSAFLAGRKELLAELGARLAGSEGAGPRVAGLYGLGGAGKTSVALAYAHDHLAEVGLAWQFAAEDATVLKAGFGELAAQLGARDAGDPVVAVHGVLAADRAQWLLVFDNAPSWDSVAVFVPPAGRGRVLITSRDQIWLPGRALEVPVLDQQVAAEFLANRVGDPGGQAAWDLAGELGGLPLALEQAAAYVQASGGSLAGYLAAFRRRRANLLGRGEPIGYLQTVATTWRVAFENVQQAEPGATGLLRLLAFCAPEAIPLPLLLQPRPGLAGQLSDDVAPVLTPLLEDEFAAGDAVAALRRYSLVTPAANGSVSVHRLVQAVTADQMPAELAGNWHQAAAALIEAAIPADTEPPATWPACAELLPHAQAALADDSDGMARMANYLGRSGSYAAARDLQRKGVEARERVLGPEHPRTLTARHWLARWTGEAGEPAAARELFAAELPVSERVLGRQHPHTLNARANLAGWTGKAGGAAAARDQLAAILPELERVLGPEHPDTLDARYELAFWTGEAGDAAAARDQFAALLPMLERVLGLEHPDTLGARHSLAYWTGWVGDAAAARDQFTALLPIRERVLGAEHPDTLTTRRDLAYWTAQAGDWAAARDQFATLLPIHERVLGPEHPRTLANRSGLAVWTGQAGDAAAARDQFAALLPSSVRVLGAEHPDALADRANLAYWTGAAGDAAGARDQLAALLPVMERVSRADHPYTLAARARRAYWTGAAGDAAGARDQYTALLPVIERVWGPEHPETLIARGNLAVWTGQAGDAAGARDQLAALLPIRDRVSSAEDPDTLTERARLAHWTREAGDAATARDQYAALLPILERVLGPEHPETQAAQENLPAG
jgi:Domain of unknown function (DUF4062)/Tetratricopeptide repeat